MLEPARCTAGGWSRAARQRPSPARTARVRRGNRRRLRAPPRAGVDPGSRSSDERNLARSRRLRSQPGPARPRGERRTRPHGECRKQAPAFRSRGERPELSSR
jgi:hypothetical protein